MRNTFLKSENNRLGDSFRKTFFLYGVEIGCQCDQITAAHCSYLNIYILRKIRLCVVDWEGQFQTTLLAKPIYF